MSCFVITYEVALKSTKVALGEKLKTYGSYCPIHRNAWAIVTSQTATQVRDALTPLLGPTDRLFVVRSGTAAAWWRSYGDKHNEWLKKNL